MLVPFVAGGPSDIVARVTAPEEYAGFQRAEIARWAAVLRTAGIRAE